MSKGLLARKLGMTQLFTEQGTVVSVLSLIHIYKSSQEVVNAVVTASLAEIEHRLRPLASLKAADARPRRGRRDAAER